MATSIGVCGVRTYHTELLVGAQSVGSSLAAFALEVSMLSVNRGVVIGVAFWKSSLAGFDGLAAAAGSHSPSRATAVAMVVPA
jgi:hypothetical protein